MRSIAAAFLLTGCLFIAGCTIVPGVESTDLSSVREETATRAEVESALGEPDLSRVTDEGRIDVYLYDRGAEDKTYGNPLLVGGWVLAPFLWAMTPFAYAKKVDEQESYLTVLYDRQDRVVAYASWPIAETPEEAITLYERQAERQAEHRVKLEACDLPFSEAIQLEAAIQYERALSCRGSGRLTQWNWECLAAHQGDSDSQYRIAGYYKFGLVPIQSDVVAAYKWYSLASMNGTESASNYLGFVAQQMTPAEIAEAERLVAEWEPNPAECEIEAASHAN